MPRLPMCIHVLDIDIVTCEDLKKIGQPARPVGEPLVEEVVLPTEIPVQYEASVSASAKSDLTLSNNPDEGSSFWTYIIGIGIIVLVAFIVW